MALTRSEVELLEEIEVLQSVSPLKAIELIESNWTSFERKDVTLARAFELRSNLSRLTGYLDLAETCGRSSRTIYERLDDPEGQASTAVSQGQILSWRGLKSSALQCYDRAIALTESPSIQSRAYRCKAVALLAFGRIQEAFTVCQKALILISSSSRQPGDASKLQPERAGVVAVLASCYSQINNHKAALSLAEDALALHHESNNQVGQCDLLCGIGFFAAKSGDPERALAYWQSASDKAEVLGLEYYVALANSNIITWYSNHGKHKESLPHVRRLELLCIDCQSPLTISAAAMGLSSYYSEKGRSTQAIALLHYALELANRSSDRLEILKLLTQLIACYETSGDVKSALRSLKLYLTMKDSIFLPSTPRQMFSNESPLSSDISIVELDSTDAYLQSTQEAMLVHINSAIEGLSPTKGALGKDESHLAFMRMLLRKYPDLTPMELKICSLLRLTLHSKQIARILSLSVRTIEDHRFRIRSKLNLPAKVNLCSHLASL